MRDGHVNGAVGADLLIRPPRPRGARGAGGRRTASVTGGADGHRDEGSTANRSVGRILAGMHVQPGTAATTFDTLPADSRVWVFAADHALSSQERDALTQTMETVLGKWGIKQPGMVGCFELRDDRFLVVGANEGAMHLDGCSVDAMMSWFQRLETQLGLRLTDRMAVHYRDADGAVQSAPRHVFAERIAGGDITLDTPVFDQTIHSVGAYRDGRFEVPLRESWHAQMFG